jgi:DNA polymerase-3 subunit chi
VTSIDFYFNAGDRLQVACRLAGKAVAQKKRMLIYAPDAEVAARIDKMLWTWPAIGFVPHVAAHDPLAAQTPVLIAGGEQDSEMSPAGIEVLLNLSAQCPPHFERFERLLELVGTEDEEKNAGRERYRFYRDRGYPIANHDLSGETRPADG